MNRSDVTTVAKFLLDRLTEIGIGHLFGVPGDFNLGFLDDVLAHGELSWVGTTNELNAAYAADGYARSRGVAALLTTFGVGELSAINGLAGSFAEYVPVLQIVGAPSTRSQGRHEILHHTLGDGVFSHFLRMHESITVARAVLTPENAVTEIDRVLTQMLLHRRPAYLVLPTDVAPASVMYPGPFQPPEAHCDPDQLAAFCDEARQYLSRATHTAVLADFLVDRFNVRHELKQLVDAGKFPCATMLMGKGVLDESEMNFVGTYVAAASEANIRDAIEGADLLIAVGTLFTDVLTAGFSHEIAAERLIDLQPFQAMVAGRVYEGVPLRASIAALGRLIKEAGWGDRKREVPGARRDDPVRDRPSSVPLDQAVLWDRVQQFLRPGDIVVADQGTCSFGIGDKRLPSESLFLSQPLWGSIGYAIPAALGASMAHPKRRLMVLTGDGAALMTANEISTMLRHKLKPVILLVNNDGYAIERAIHGAEQAYNDIPTWNWRMLPAALGAQSRSISLHAATVGELDFALAAAESADLLVLLEVILPKQDVPKLLFEITKSVGQVGGCRRQRAA